MRTSGRFDDAGVPCPLAGQRPAIDFLIVREHRGEYLNRPGGRIFPAPARSRGAGDSDDCVGVDRILRAFGLARQREAST